jgi:hypothetical protein
VTSAARPNDAFGFLKPLSDVATGVGDAIGGALSEAHKLPVIGGALDTLGAVADATIRTPIGLAALGADKFLGTGLTAAAERANAGRPIWELPKTAAATVLGGIGQVADNPNENPFVRALAGGVRTVDTVGEMVAPLPGLGLAAGALKGGAARLGRDIAPVAAKATRIVDQPIPAIAHTAPISELRPTPAPISEANPFRSVGTKTSPLPEAGSMGPGHNPSTTFSRLDPDLQRSIAAADAEAGGFVAQRRGHISVPEMKQMASEVGADPTFVDKVVQAKPGTAMNPEEFLATANAIKSAATRRRALQQQIADAGGPQHASSEIKAQTLLAAVEQMSLQNAMAGARSEWGRTGVALRQALGEAAATKSAAAYDKALQLVGGRSNAEAIIKRLHDIWETPGSDVAKARDTYRFLHDLGQPGFMDKAKELWINSVLSSPVTQMVNNISNEALLWTQVPTRALAATSEAALTLGGQLRPREVFFSEVPAYAFGILRGTSQGLAKGLHIAVHGIDLGDASKFAEGGKMASTGAIGGTAGRVIRLPTTLMAAGDAFAKARAMQAEISARAARIASSERLKGNAWAQRVAELEATPTPEMLTAATREAKYVTLQSEADKMTAGFMQLRNNAPAGIGTFIVPFVQVPMNVVKRGFEYSPAGYLRAISETGAERSMALARATIGSGVMTYFAQKLLDGSMTAGAPINPADRDAFYRSGKIPYAIKIGDEWVEYGRLEPLMTPVKWMASAYEAFRDGKDTSDAVLKAVGAMTGALKDASYLNGVSSLLDTLSDPERYAGQEFSQIAKGFIPYSSLLRNVAAADDPFVRKPQGIVQDIAAGLPGASKTVPPKLDAYGQPVRRGPLDTGPGALFDPRRVGVDTRNAATRAVDDEINRVQQHADLNQTGFTSKKIKDTTLDQQGAFRYQEIAGAREQAAIAALIDSPAYRAMTWDDKAKAIEKARTKARTDAQGELAKEILPRGNPFTAAFSEPFAKEKPRTGNPFLRGQVTPTGNPFLPASYKATPATNASSGPKPSSPDLASLDGGSDVRATIRASAQSSGIDPLLALATAQVESGFNQYAVGDNGESHGVMQENVHGRGAGRAPDYSVAGQTQRFAADVRRLLATGFTGTPGQIAAAAQRPANAARYAQLVDAAYRALRQ